MGNPNHLPEEDAMRAAVVTAFDQPPHLQEVPDPVAADPDEIVLELVAAGLHPRVRSQADGSHYTSTGALPLVPGVDGVGRDADGSLRYFVLDEDAAGSFSERVLVDARRSVVLPADADPLVVAAAMNPAMSSWIALRRRIAFEPGGRVLVLGATGNAGRLAVPIARRLGAGEVIAVARDAGRLAALPALGATAVHELGDPALGAGIAEVDVVLDYLWGEPAAQVMAALVTARADRSRPLAWVQIGAVTGPTAPIPSAALRASRLQLVGSGQGSVGPREILAELPALAEELTSGALPVTARAVPLADVERVWGRPTDPAERIVVVP
jgi:NADPH:quinone reductase-like Zn-dependent oxidoreductase